MLKSTIVHVGFAFVAMGGWAMFANASHPPPQQVLAGLAQGTMSALLTLFLKSATDGMRSRFRGKARYWLPPLIAILASISFLVCGHWLAHTPEILLTIAVPATVSSSYVFIYNFIRLHNRAGG